MEPIFSSKRKKLSLHYELQPDVYAPMLITPSAKVKYRHMRHSVTPVVGKSFNSFPDLLEKITNIGWDCLVITFTDRQIYPSLITEFYCHMIFHKDLTGLLTGITTCIQGEKYDIIEQLILHALHLRDLY